MNWIPKNKKTQVEYKPITDEQKKEWEADPSIGPKYTFKQVKEAPKPKEAKKITGITSKELK